MQRVRYVEASREFQSCRSSLPPVPQIAVARQSKAEWEREMARMRARRWTAEDMRSVLAHDRFHQDIKDDEMRRAARTDNNQHELVEALKKIGARCYYIKEPVDLVVGFRGRTLLLEVKGEGKPLTQAQQEFMATWPGEVHVCRTIDEAIAAVIGRT
jgi:hypothetical protein